MLKPLGCGSAWACYPAAGPEQRAPAWKRSVPAGPARSPPQPVQRQRPPDSAASRSARQACPPPPRCAVRSAIQNPAVSAGGENPSWSASMARLVTAPGHVAISGRPKTPTTAPLPEEQGWSISVRQHQAGKVQPPRLRPNGHSAIAGRLPRPRSNQFRSSRHALAHLGDDSAAPRLPWLAVEAWSTNTLRQCSSTGGSRHRCVITR